MTDGDKQAAFMREYQERFDKKLRDNEIAVLEYWREQLLKTVGARPEGIAALQQQVRRIADMMENRIKILKKG